MNSHLLSRSALYVAAPGVFEGAPRFPVPLWDLEFQVFRLVTQPVQPFRQADYDNVASMATPIAAGRSALMSYEAHS